MTTFIIAKQRKSIGQTKVDKHRVAANITEYPNISKPNFLRIIILKFKFMMIRQLSHVKINVKIQNVKINMFKMDILVTIIELLRLLHCT